MWASWVGGETKLIQLSGIQVMLGELLLLSSTSTSINEQKDSISKNSFQTLLLPPGFSYLTPCMYNTVFMKIHMVQICQEKLPAALQEHTETEKTF